MIQGDYTHETREYGRAFIQNLQARIRELEGSLRYCSAERDSMRARITQLERDNPK